MAEGALSDTVCAVDIPCCYFVVRRDEAGVQFVYHPLTKVLALFTTKTAAYEFKVSTSKFDATSDFSIVPSVRLEELLTANAVEHQVLPAHCLKQSVETSKKSIIDALKANKGNARASARDLKITPATLYAYVKKLGLIIKDYRSR